jgi:hypothetical protein
MIMTTNKRCEHRQSNDYFFKGKWSRDGNNKQNLHHNSTAKKEGYKNQRNLILMNYYYELEDYLWCLNFTDDIDY